MGSKPGSGKPLAQAFDQALAFARAVSRSEQPASSLQIEQQGSPSAPSRNINEAQALCAQGTLLALPLSELEREILKFVSSDLGLPLCYHRRRDRRMYVEEIAYEWVIKDSQTLLPSHNI